MILSFPPDSNDWAVDPRLPQGLYIRTPYLWGERTTIRSIFPGLHQIWPVLGRPQLPATLSMGRFRVVLECQDGNWTANVLLAGSATTTTVHLSGWDPTRREDGNACQDLALAIQLRFPNARVKMEAPKQPDGHWTLDCMHDGRWAVVEWRPPTTFGISLVTDDTAYGEGPDWVTNDIEQARARAVELLGG